MFGWLQMGKDESGVMLIWLMLGLSAAIIMFVGDMLLYYDKQDYVSDGTFHTVIALMKKVSDKRLYVGGIIGPIAAFLYCLGYVHIFYIVHKSCLTVSVFCFMICSLAIVVGGAYHSHCSYLGIIGKLEDEKSMNSIIKYFSIINMISMIFQVIGLLTLAILIVCGFTILPRWFSLLTLGVLYLLLPLWKRLPRGIHIIVCGGWANLIFVIYYVMLILHYFMCL